MFCPKCGNQISEQTKFCPKCGASMLPPGRPKKAPAPSKIQRPVSAPNPTPEPPKKGFPIIAVLAGVILLLAACGAAFVLGSKKAEQVPEETQESDDLWDNWDEETEEERLVETTAAAETEAFVTQAYETTAAAAPTPEALSSQTYDTMYVVNCNESISLRTSPSTSATAIRQIPYGAAVSYIGTSENGFYKVSYHGDTGYSLASYLSYQPAPPKTNTYTTMWVVNCNESITLRTSPSTKAAEICQIPLGATVSYIETASNGFYKVTYLGKTGYALASYLSN